MFNIFIPILMRRHQFGEEAPFYCLFERGGTILLGKFGRRLVECFYLCPKPCWRLARVSFMVHALPGGLSDSIFIKVAIISSSMEIPILILCIYIQ